jgi:enolase-phosphatase E1
MITVQADGVLLDIEGTTSSIQFVYDEMFPYVRDSIGEYLQQNWDQPALQATLDGVAQDLGFSQRQEWLTGDSIDQQRQQVVAGVFQLMDADRKVTGLKQLQGQIWKSGFHSGRLVAHLYPDVAPAIKNWKAAGLDVRIYSSGSVAAQRLFFGHTVAGDLLGQLSGHYDTTTGAKQDPESYRKIAVDFQLPVDQILFISDLPGELQAASEAGMQVLLSCRPENPPIKDPVPFRAITSFAQIRIAAN